MFAQLAGGLQVWCRLVPEGIEVRAPALERSDELLTPAALAFVAGLEREFGGRRRALLAARAERQARLDAGELLGFDPADDDARAGDWRVRPAPADLQDRRVEITGPTERKMVVGALNSGARGFMADFEDATSPTWRNLVQGQLNLTDAIERRIDFTSPEGKDYKLAEETATLIVRPRGWHLPERHLVVDGEPAAGALFDFGLFLFHNAERLLERGSGPYFYLPKLEGRAEAQLWANVIAHSEHALGLDPGTVRVTVLIETVPAAFAMEEILYELREHAVGLNAGRWDYIFSMIKCFREHPEFVLPDRSQVTMTVPFMRAYTELLVSTCHRRGAHAMGGMAALIPNRRDPEASERAIEGVRSDKQREAGDGFDGTWVAHPDLVAAAREQFDAVLGERPNQLDRRRDDVKVSAGDLLAVASTPGEVTAESVERNIEVALEYIDAWLGGSGAVAINDLMEDAATAEIARSQVWQWLRHGVPAAGDAAHVRRLIEAGGRSPRARALLAETVLAERLPDFFTLPAYELLEDD